MKPADQRTLEYLREIAIQAARDLASGKLKKKPRKKNMMDKVTTLCGLVPSYSIFHPENKLGVKETLVLLRPFCVIPTDLK